MFKIVKDKESWNKILEEVSVYDFYHTYQYHIISKSEMDTPLLIVFKYEGATIAIPLLLRRIFDTDYYDLTSVYGYVGPLYKNIEGVNFQLFQENLKVFLLEQNVVSIFSRLHPYLDRQNFILKGLGSIKFLGKIVNIDISLPLDIQKQKMSATTKRYINKARRKFEVFKVNPIDTKSIQIFKKLYIENMNRVHAKPYYFFDDDYFNGFLEAKDFEVDLWFVKDKETDEVVSGAFIIKTTLFIQYHISGTKNEFLKDSPIRLIIDTIRIQGTKKEYTYFNLGGGLGSTDDALFYFKSSFSKDFYDFQVWNYIVQPKVYEALSKKYASINSNPNFFPRYRS